jgi:hypothetical protein
MLPVVYVHIGSKPAPHLVDSIAQTRCVSPATPIFVILSRDTTMAADVKGPNTTVVFSDTLQTTDSHLAYVRNVRRRLGKKRGFWRFTTERFFLIEEHMAQFGLPAVLHLESDNLIFFDVQAIEATLKGLYPGIATPFLNDDQCVPGVVYIGDCSVLADLNAYIAERVSDEATGMRRWYRPWFLARVRMGIKLHDMNLLADFRKQGAADRLRPLPMVPPEYTMAPDSVGRTDCALCYSYGFDELKMIFDGAAFGQYLYGLDPNHHDATGTVGMINPESCVRPTDFEFDELDLSDRHSVPHLTYKGARIRLASLHNHSKRRLFS